MNYFVVHLGDEDIEEALAEEDLEPLDLVQRDGVSLPGWYWAKTANCQRNGKMRGPYLTQQEAFTDARRSAH